MQSLLRSWQTYCVVHLYKRAISQCSIIHHNPNFYFPGLFSLFNSLSFTPLSNVPSHCNFYSQYLAAVYNRFIDGPYIGLYIDWMHQCAVHYGAIARWETPLVARTQCTNSTLLWTLAHKQITHICVWERATPHSG